MLSLHSKLHPRGFSLIPFSEFGGSVTHISIHLPYLLREGMRSSLQDLFIRPEGMEDSARLSDGKEGDSSSGSSSSLCKAEGRRSVTFSEHNEVFEPDGTKEVVPRSPLVAAHRRTKSVLKTKISSLGRSVKNVRREEELVKAAIEKLGASGPVRVKKFSFNTSTEGFRLLKTSPDGTELMWKKPYSLVWKKGEWSWSLS